MNVKEVEVRGGKLIAARVVTHDPVEIPDEKLLRRLLEKFYTDKVRDFSRVAMQVTGTVILFRPIPNGKRPPNTEDVTEVLKAVNLSEVTPPARSHARKKTKPPATRWQQSQTT